MSAITAEESRTIIDAGIAGARVSSGLLLRALEGFEGDAWVKSTHDTGNHTLWTLGHLTVSAAGFANFAGSAFDGLPESYNALFNMGTEPKADLSAYPDPAEVTEHYKAASAHVHQAWLDADAEAMAEKPEGFFGEMFPAKSHVAMFLGHHEMTHIGQVLMIRRMLGMPRVIG